MIPNQPQLSSYCLDLRRLVVSQYQAPAARPKASNHSSQLASVDLTCSPAAVLSGVGSTGEIGALGEGVGAGSTGLAEGVTGLAGSTGAGLTGFSGFVGSVGFIGSTGLAGGTGPGPAPPPEPELGAA